jgi:Protein of unknown function (DUF3987)
MSIANIQSAKTTFAKLDPINDTLGKGLTIEIVSGWDPEPDPQYYGSWFVSDCRGRGLTCEQARAETLEAENLWVRHWGRSVDEREFRRAWENGHGSAPEAAPAARAEPAPAQEPKPEPDRGQLETFIRTTFKHATPGTWVSLRCFYQEKGKIRSFSITPVKLIGNFDGVINQAYREATIAAREPRKVVFSPPVATFTNHEFAKEKDLAEGVVLNVDCDKHPRAALAKLIALLGQPTMVVESGGTWTDPKTGESEPKLHVYYLLKVPARGQDELAKLKAARRFATKLVGGDGSNISIVHPIRWPGSIHRKGDPKLCRIASCNPDIEIDLDAALGILQKAAGDAPTLPGKPPAAMPPIQMAHAFRHLDPKAQPLGEGIEEYPPLPFAPIKAGCAFLRVAFETGGKGYDNGLWNLTNLIAVFLEDGEKLIHAFSKGHDKYTEKETNEQWARKNREHKEKDLGWPKCQTIKDNGCKHCDTCPHLAAGQSPLHLGLQHIPPAAPEPEPLVVPRDLWAKFDAPPLPTNLLPEVIEKFAFAQAELMGCDPAGIAMSALTACAVAIPDEIKVRVKQHDPRWQESTRLWTGLVGPPSTMKSPTMLRAIEPLKQIDNYALARYMEAMAAYEKLPDEERKGAEKPKLSRIMLGDTTPEAAQLVLQDNPNGVLLFRDELSGWFGSMDKYSGHRGAASDRGFWLQSYNGGQYYVDRVTRRSGRIPNLSVSILGGIQVEPLRALVAEGVDDGLIQRILPIMLRPAVLGKDEPLPADQYDRLVEQLNKMPYRVVEFDAAAQQIRQKLEQKHIDLMAFESVNRKLAAHIGKYNGLFARLCLLWHCIENVNTDGATINIHNIDADTTQRVADFLHGFLLPHAISFYVGVVGLADDHDRLANVAGYILAHRLECITPRDIARGDRSMRKLNRQDTDSILHQLDALGWVNKIQGRRFHDVQWAVNPEVHRLFKERAKAEADRRQREREAIATGYEQQGKG